MEQNASTQDGFEKPEMTAEQKKAQRAAKAAEKKARAEAAAAKKQGAAEPVTARKETPPPELVVHKPKIIISPESGRQIIVQRVAEPPKEVVQKGLLKTGKRDSDRCEKTVKFDLSPCSDGESEKSPIPPNSAGIVKAFSFDETDEIHPAFLTLAIRAEKEEIHEVDELCKEFLTTFKEFLADWAKQRFKEEEHSKDIGHDLDAAIRPQIAHLTNDGRWALPAALGNLVRHLKREILRMGPEEKEAVDSLQNWIDGCRQLSFDLAYEAISNHLSSKLTNSRGIVTYSRYQVVEHVLLRYKDIGLTCCVVDDEMNGRGLGLVKSLADNGIVTQYTDLTGLSCVVPKSSMVLLGCSAVLSNGNVTSARGSLQLALTAKAFNVPVLVLAQSFKFVDKVQSASRVALLRRDADETIPADLITALVTDIRILPPTSAPAVVKSKALAMD